jgi:hypothetical protein
MTGTTGPVLDLEKVLFLDRRNQKFVDKSSPVTGRVREAQGQLWATAIGSLIVCALLLAVATASQLRRSQLARNGKETTAVVVAKRVVPGSNGETSCYVTYRFPGPPIYEREIKVSSRVCPTLVPGHATAEVIYDPSHPSVSEFKVSAEKPNYLVWLAALGCLLAFALTRVGISNLRRERRLCAEGSVVCGSIVSKEHVPWGRETFLQVRFRFQTPSGSTIESEAKGPDWRTNWTDWRDYSMVFHCPYDSVAVLFLSDTDFALL